MKILLVDLEYDYGDEKRGLNYIRDHGYQYGLTKSGHEIQTFFYDKYLNKKEELQKKLIEICKKINPNLIFFILFRDHFDTSTLKLLKKKYKTINWFGDDTWRFEKFTKKYAKCFDYCITTDKFSLDKYKKLGVEKIVLSQWAAIEKIKLPIFKKYEYEVSFVGGINPYRKWFIDCLIKKGIKVECFGYGWKNGTVSGEEMYHIFRSSKINLNLSNSISYDLRYLCSSPVHILHNLKSTKVTGQIKARNFEISYAGGFQLTDYIPSLEDYYFIGKEVACYSSLEDAIRQIKYYLSNEMIREQIRFEGERKSRSTHGYSHRFKLIFETIIP
ncbi:MAG: glycosyltransferase [Bdellovibrionaceae bacterium]|nr:glycosyltransferase [Pseudobdellovibrionaceae bacterium]